MDSAAIRPIPKGLRGKTCYACENPATGKDHVPPKFLFPEEIDLGSKYGNLRRNLITVPACDTHNTELSGDDTYFVIFAVACSRNNTIATDHFLTKIQRSMDEDPRVAEWYAEAIYRGGQRGVRHGELDRERFDRCITKIVKGLYYKITGRKLLCDGNVYTYSPDIVVLDADVLRLKHQYEWAASMHDKWFVRYRAGSPRVFSVRYFLDLAKPHRVAFKLTFYEGFSVWAVHDDAPGQTSPEVPAHALELTGQ